MCLFWERWISVLEKAARDRRALFELSRYIKIHQDVFRYIKIYIFRYMACVSTTAQDVLQKRDADRSAARSRAAAWCNAPRRSSSNAARNDPGSRQLFCCCWCF